MVPYSRVFPIFLPIPYNIAGIYFTYSHTIITQYLYCWGFAITFAIFTLNSCLLDQLRIRKIKDFHLHYSFSGILPLLMQIWVSYLHNFPSLWRTSFNIPWRTGLLVTDSLSFCFSEKFYFSLLKYNVSEYWIPGWCVFFFLSIL